MIGETRAVSVQTILTTISEVIIEADVRGWNSALLPLEPGEVLDLANKVADISEHRQL